MSAGLSTADAARRLTEFGPNEIRRDAGPAPWRIFAGQLNSPVIWLLLGACVLSGVLGEVADVVAIATIVILNAGVGFLQEYRAERAMQALRSMTAPHARVRRDGHATSIPAVTIVPGDVLLLEAGDVVAADAQVLVADRLSTNEAALTGESADVPKSVAAVSVRRRAAR